MTSELVARRMSIELPDGELDGEFDCLFLIPSMQISPHRQKGAPMSADSGMTSSPFPDWSGPTRLPPPPVPSAIAVIDVETTGFNANRSDRVVEIACVVIEPDGNVIREFATLLNPERDIGPTHVHGITASDIRHAPRFADIAGTLVETLDGCAAIAGHNIGFDRRFLIAEFKRLGFTLDEIPTLCTMRLSGGGTLQCTCTDFGIAFDGRAHSALHDARATARLLSTILRDTPTLIEEFNSLRPIGWPTVPKTSVASLRREMARQRTSEPPTYIQRLLSRVVPDLPSESDDQAIHEYTALLSRVLEDRYIAEEEGTALLDLADDWGIPPIRIRQANCDYLFQLAVAALADGQVTEGERQDIMSVSSMLGLTEEDIDRAFFRAEQQRTIAAPTAGSDTADFGIEPFVGKRVCFTGESQCTWKGETLTRTAATALAMELGLVVTDSVTKNLDILVVADAHTQSGKARLARRYEVRIIHERAFWHIFGMEVS